MLYLGFEKRPTVVYAVTIRVQWKNMFNVTFIYNSEWRTAPFISLQVNSNGVDVSTMIWSNVF